MKKVNLNTLSLAELIRIQKEIPKAIKKAQKSEKASLIKKMEALAAESGFDLNDVLANKKAKKPRKKVKAKYRNPNKASETWTGRGRKPLWVAQHLSDGGSLDDVLI